MSESKYLSKRLIFALTILAEQNKLGIITEKERSDDLSNQRGYHFI